MMTILSWNVNGLRAIYRKGFIPWFTREEPEILCLQETKAREEQLPDELLDIKGYHVYFASALRKGYSGVALYTKIRPCRIQKGFGIKRFDCEGRSIIAEYKNIILCNIYFPNGKMSPERLQYKLDFYDAFLDFAVNLKKREKNIVICGDVNTAHTELDLARPKENQKVSGFLPQERAWIDAFIGKGFIDTFRMFHQGGGYYTWWDFKTRARERDTGWRIDYFFINHTMRKQLRSAFIKKEVMGSDHCPIGITLAL